MNNVKNYFNAKEQEIVTRLMSTELLKTVNIHNTPPYMAEKLEEQLAFYSQKYCPFTIEDLHEYSLTGKWTKPRPGIVFALFEGYRNNFDVYYPLLEKYGMTGWFFIISDFMDVPESEQREYALAHDIDPCERHDFGFGYPGEDRIAMSWDEIRELSKKHEIICHTASHLSMAETNTDEFLHREIVDSKHNIEQHIGREIEMFCSLWGYGYGHSEKIAKHIRDAGYKYVWGGYGVVERVSL